MWRTFRAGCIAPFFINVPGAPHHCQNCICLRPEALWHSPEQIKEAAELRYTQVTRLHGAAQPCSLPSEQLHGGAGSIWHVKAYLRFHFCVTPLNNTVLQKEMKVTSMHVL